MEPWRTMDSRVTDLPPNHFLAIRFPRIFPQHNLHPLVRWPAPAFAGFPLLSTRPNLQTRQSIPSRLETLFERVLKKKNKQM